MAAGRAGRRSCRCSGRMAGGCPKAAPPPPAPSPAGRCFGRGGRGRTQGGGGTAGPGRFDLKKGRRCFPVVSGTRAGVVPRLRRRLPSQRRRVIGPGAHGPRRWVHADGPPETAGSRETTGERKRYGASGPVTWGIGLNLGAASWNWRTVSPSQRHLGVPWEGRPGPSPSPAGCPGLLSHEVRTCLICTLTLGDRKCPCMWRNPEERNQDGTPWAGELSKMPREAADAQGTVPTLSGPQTESHGHGPAPTEGPACVRWGSSPYFALVNSPQDDPAAPGNRPHVAGAQPGQEPATGT